MPRRESQLAPYSSTAPAVCLAVCCSSTPTYKDTWDIPGGYVERGESPAAACRREIAEELGLDRQPRRLTSVDWAPHEHEGDKLLFLFDCGDLGADEQHIHLGVNELDRWAWVDLDQLDHYVLPRIARRIRSAVDNGSRTSYLEHGKLPDRGR